jgi:hypothetical protein
MTKTSFVIMPFSSTPSCTESQWTEIFEDVIRPAFVDCGYECERVKPSVGNLTGSIVDKLRTSSVVLADLTDRNPNVFYELGIRHTLRRGTIIIAQGSEHVPSDLRGYWFLTYGIRPAEVRTFRSNIADVLRNIEADPSKSDNPVADYLEKQDAVVSSYVQRENLKKLSALITEISGNIVDLRSGGRYLSYGCLELLLQTRYIDPGPEVLRRAYELWHVFKSIDSGDRVTETVDIAAERLEALSPLVQGLYDNLGKGEFTEPRNISAMIWSTAPEFLQKSIAVVNALTYKGARTRPADKHCEALLEKLHDAPSPSGIDPETS